ncbi:unnamed protein product [Cylicocyclus nassatus]|uniref:Sulfotransferase n=1 Tax=Cylicocyclus nassatus TaxID=53992 RepID=A0AA36HAH9_CYLNA|nr:unnamed protein product [Cylicocyclus nassatus]
MTDQSVTLTDHLYPYTLLLITLIFSLYSYLDRSDGMNKSVGSLPWRNLSEMEVVKKFNSDALPNRTDTRTADEMCSNYSDYQCIPPLRIFEAKFRVRIAPKYKISTCLIQKCMSTVMQAIFCFLSDEDGFRQSGRKFFSESQHMRSCANHFKAPSMQNLLWRIYEHNEDGWMHTMVIRDPVDRFLSGFIDKCIRDHLPGAYCNGCKANMTCFIIKEYERMVIEVAQPKSCNFSQSGFCYGLED